jgi:hypothetical protein
MQHYMSIELQHFHPKVQFPVPQESTTMGRHRIMTVGIQIQEKDKKNTMQKHDGSLFVQHRSTGLQETKIDKLFNTKQNLVAHLVYGTLHVACVCSAECRLTSLAIFGMCRLLGN